MRDGVVEDVGQRLAQEDLVDVESGQVVGDRDLQVSAHPRPVPLQDRIQQLGQGRDLEIGRERARLDPAHVEQRVDESIHALRFVVDRAGRRASLGLIELDGGIGQAAGRRADRRQRGAQVVRHRVEERRTQLVAPALDLGIGRGGGEPVSTQRLGHLVGGRRQEPGLLERRLTGLRRPLRPERADLLAVGDERDAVSGHGRRPWAPSTGPGVNADPARGVLRAVSLQDAVGADGLHRSAARVTQRALAGDRRTDTDPRPRHPGVGTDAVEHRPDRAREARSGGQLSRDGEQRPSLSLPLRGEALAVTLGTPQAPDDDSHEEEQEQRDQLLRTRDGQGEPRLDEEEVVDDERAERGQQRGGRALTDRDHRHREQVEGAGTLQPKPDLEDPDDRGRRRERGDDLDHPPPANVHGSSYGRGPLLEHEQRDEPLRSSLVGRVQGKGFGHERPEPIPLLSGGLARHDRPLLAADRDGRVRLRSEVVDPRRVAHRASPGRGDHERALGRLERVQRHRA